ncbi:cell division protein FtsZ [uncultured Brachyspira sp.]|uniref:cell division protein FtsZ n=2 Tax=uncultured Brachyspira sp. TaxID=221953 RepID=UPI0025DC88AD|nr:cell division protein FtsZ [uncultured Brachyspira sp.]
MNPNYRIELADNIKGNEKMIFNNNSSSLDTVIKVIGVGNGGCNAVNRMIEEGLENVEFIAMNTDSQALSRSNAPVRIVLGDRITQGLGAGTDPEKGAEAAREDIAKIEEIVSGANLVFIASSFGGGTGTGASPVVAEAAKKAGALTIGVVTKPFDYEGKLKMNRAESGIDKMLTVVDSLIIIPNENLYDMVDMDNYSYEQALSVVDDILRQGVQGISDIITQTGFINVDFADVKTMISLSNGRAHLGIGVGKGDDRLQKAITNAFENPLLDVSSIKNARGILANIVCPKDFAMKEYREASKTINNYANENANIKIGVCPKDELKDEIIVTIVATGFDANTKNDNEDKDADSHANNIFISNSNASNDSKIINDNNINDSDTDNSRLENKADNKVEVNEKIITDSKILSNNKTENISEIDNINTMIKEPEHKKEVELETSKYFEEELNKTEELNKIEGLNKTEENKINNNKVKETDNIKEFKEINEIKEIDKEKKTYYDENLKYTAEEENSNRFENNIRSLKKPLISKVNRFSNIDENNDNISERFNRTIINNKTDSVNNVKTSDRITSDRIKEDMRFDDEEKHNNPHTDYTKKPFDIVSDDYMDKHNKMGSKMSIFGETAAVDNDLEKPAFLRRQIQARNTIR